MRFHVLGIPHTVTSKEYVACAYTQKALKFCKMMKALGHTVIHYGHEDSDVDCDEHVTVVTNDDLKIAYGDYDWRKHFFKFDLNDHAYQTFFKNAIVEVGKRKQQNDFILPFWGQGTKPVCDAHPDLITVEPGIGYAEGQWARWRIYESHAIMNSVNGTNCIQYCNMDWYHTVIPNYFDLDEFEYCEEKDDYFLYLGRVYAGKGVDIAVQMTEMLGKKLIIAGQGSLKEMGYETTPAHVTEIGYADIETRKRLMSKAKALIIGSTYCEPFGGVQIEAMLSGTPVISPDWGAFVECNIHGYTGFRCRTFADFVEAGRKIGTINPKNCRSWGENFSLEKIALMYQKYFQDILNVFTGAGWYEMGNENLEVTTKNLPLHAALPYTFDYDHMEQEEKPFFDRLAIWVAFELKPTKTMDLGCGPGMFVYSLRDNDVDAVGLDVDERVIGKEHLKYESMFEPQSQYDLVSCIEVAEHIDTEMNDKIVESVCNTIKYKGKLIWSAAKPGQGGVGHINCQTKDFWSDKFTNGGLTRNFELENKLRAYLKEGVYMGWFLQNFMIFDKQ